MPRLIESNIDIEDERAPCLVAKLKCLLSKYDIYTVFVGIFDDCFFYHRSEFSEADITLAIANFNKLPLPIRQRSVDIFKLVS